MLTPLEHEVLNRIDDTQLIQWIQELTRIPSVWRPEQGKGEAAAAQWIADRCRAMGLTTL